MLEGEENHNLLLDPIWPKGRGGGGVMVGKGATTPLPSRGSWVHNTRTRSQVVTSLLASEGPHLGKMGTQSLPYPSVPNAHHGERIGVVAYPLTSRWAHMCVEWLHHPCFFEQHPCHLRGSPMLTTGTKLKLVAHPLTSRWHHMCMESVHHPSLLGVPTSPMPSWSSYILGMGTKSQFAARSPIA